MHPTAPSSLRRILCAVIPAMLASALLAVLVAATGRDFPNHDDLSRTVLAQGWAATPYFFTSDVYWLPLPFIVRGGVIRVLTAWFGEGAGVGLAGVRAVTALYLAGSALLLARLTEGARPGGRGGWLLGLLFFGNGTTFALAGSGLSEPDSLFWLLAAVTLLRGRGGEGRAGRGGPAAAGLALLMAGLIRFENWTYAALLLAVEGRRLRREGMLPPRALAGAAVLAALPGAVWIGASVVRFGDPFHFLRQAAGYLGADEAASAPLMAAKALLRPFGAATPLLAWAAWRGLRRMEAGRRAPLLALAGAMTAWTLLKLLRMNAHERFVWEPFMLMLVPASIRLAEGLERMTGPRGWLARCGGAALLLASMAGACAGTRSHLAPGMRAFADRVREVCAGRAVLIRGIGPAPGEDEFLHVMRIWLGHDRAIPCHWVGCCEGLSPEEAARYRLGLILARDAAEASGPVLFRGPGGWSAAAPPGG